MMYRAMRSVNANSNLEANGICRWEAASDGSDECS